METNADDGTQCARLFTVTGRVQGVWFRDSTRRQAQKLGVTGYAINLSDGSVEVFACGSPASLDALQRWLGEGPPLASVSSVAVRDTAPEQADEFIIG